MWNVDFYGGARTVRRNHIKTTADLFGAGFHIGQTVSLAIMGNVESPAVITDFEENIVTLNPEVDLDLGTVRMPHRVIDGFLKNQIKLAPNIHRKFYPLIFR